MRGEALEVEGYALEVGCSPVSDLIKRWPPIVWAGLAALAAILPILINGGPLFYFDTASYIDQGASILKTFGISPEGASASGGGAAADVAADDGDGAIVGSRAAVYALFLIVFQVTAGLTALAVAQILLFAATLWLVARGIVRMTGHSNAFLFTSLAMLAGGVTALPFVAGYLMPDIFAPILVLSVAALTVFWPHLRIWEILALLALGAFATVTHPSHFLIAVLLVPTAAIATGLVRGFKTWWLAPLLVTAIVGAAFVERVAFTTAAKTVKRAEVVYQPFLTVRAVADGPGYAYLEEHCPDATIAACALYEALQLSDDPERLTATNIMFARSEELGSFERLPQEVQGAIATSQVPFFLNVALDRPIDMGLALFGNVMDQMTRVSVRLSVPTPRMVEQMQAITAYMPDGLEEARFLGDRGWIKSVDLLHNTLYLASAAALLVFFFWPGLRAPWEMRVFVLVILGGIVVNAVVCGGISQPSARYRARMIFLLPIAAVWLAVLRPGRGSQAERGGAST